MISIFHTEEPLTPIELEAEQVRAVKDSAMKPSHTPVKTVNCFK